LTLYFIESSALAKLFVQEKGTEKLIALVEPLAGNQKLVSTLSRIEVRSAIRRRERAGDLSPAFAADALELLNAELDQTTEQPVNAVVIDAANQLIDRHPLRAMDSIQLASCCTIRAVIGISDIVFVSSDHALLAAAAAEGLQILDPVA
jgi:predicted nucleic acid-binding protein